MIPILGGGTVLVVIVPAWLFRKRPWAASGTVGPSAFYDDAADRREG